MAEIVDPAEDNEIDEDIDNVDEDVEGPNRPSNIALGEAFKKV